MDATTPLMNDHPIMAKWREYKKSDDYQNAKEWAKNPKHTEGSMWNAFLAGWLAAGENILKEENPK